MDWKLILQLSLFGLAMAIATVFWIPSDVEPFFWIPILGMSAYVIAARAPGRPFLHGVLVGLANSAWVTTAHVALFEAYIARHPREAAMAASMGSPRLVMALPGPAIGLVSGCVIGLAAVGLARRVRPASRSAIPAP